MHVLRCFIVSAAALLAASSVSAESFNDETTCGAILKIINASSPDEQQVKEVVDYTLEVMRAVDRLHQLRGQTGLFAQMLSEGRSSIALMATERCRNRESVTLADTAIETYESIRTLRTSLGPKKEARKWAHRRSLPPHLAPALVADR